MSRYHFSYLDQLEAESIHILREVAAEFENPVLMYSVGKDSSVLSRLCEKAFAPGKIPFPYLHVDTGYKFEEMYQFRDKTVADLGVELKVYRNESAISSGAHPQALGTQRCCKLLKTDALLAALEAGQHDAAIGGARRDEETSRAKERFFSFRDRHGQWDPKNQRPELWNLYNSKIHSGESIRVFPLSNWTELNIWQYILRENIPVVPLYFAKKRKVMALGQTLVLADRMDADTVEEVMCRFRSLGCSPCTGAIRSEAKTVEDILKEMMVESRSERAGRVIDHDQKFSMEKKKREGYF